jgi:hypothetical protein
MRQVVKDKHGKEFGLRCSCPICKEALDRLRKKPDEVEQILEWAAWAHLDLTDEGYELIGSGKDDGATLWAK